MIDPRLWNNVPFKDETAWRDFEGQHLLWHQAVADTAARAGKPYRTYPLQSLRSPAGRLAHQQEHVNANAALGISPPPDLASYELSKREDFASFVFLHGEESARLRVAAGVS